MKQALPAAARGKPLEIWFQDEARIGQKGTLTRIWARLGSRPLGPCDSRYEWDQTKYLTRSGPPGFRAGRDRDLPLRLRPFFRAASDPCMRR